METKMTHRWILIAVVGGFAAGCGSATMNKTGSSGNGSDMAKASNPPGEDMAMGGGGDVDLAMGGGGDVDLAMGGGGGNDMAGCPKITNLHPPKQGMPSIYCPFSAPVGMKNVYCQQGSQHCCEPNQGMSSCQPIGTPCMAKEVDWQCEDPTDCGNGMQCCGVGTFVTGLPGCGNTASHFTGTHCAKSCAQAELVMCTNSNECNGKICQPFATHGNDVGACQ
jgi:hypothetical protein